MPPGWKPHSKAASAGSQSPGALRFPSRAVLQVRKLARVSAPRIPEELTSTLPETKFGKILGATPVVMTVIATLLAGLSNSEMTKAQYARALAAQQQSKAGDQWAYFQAKRLRGAIQSGTLDIVRITEPGHEVNAAGLRSFARELPDAERVIPALGFLLEGRLPAHASAAKPDPAIQLVLDAIEDSAPDDKLQKLLADVEPQQVADAIQAARAHAKAFDAIMSPVVDGGDSLGEAIDAAGDPQLPLRRDFAELRLRYSSMRYDAEAGINRAIAALHEVQVRQSNFTAARHHRRSQRFFLGMLAAQAAVIVSTLAIAAHKRSLLWSLAAIAGLGAVAFAAWVFLYV